VKGWRFRRETYGSLPDAKYASDPYQQAGSRRKEIRMSFGRSRAEAQYPVHPLSLAESHGGKASKAFIYF